MRLLYEKINYKEMQKSDKKSGYKSHSLAVQLHFLKITANF